jgi:Tol biopolymer transport system component
MSRRALASGVAVVLAALVASLTASAAFPGKNGKIVFGSQHAGEDEIWVMSSDGTDRRNLTRHDGAKVSDIDPRWSPDGLQIAYASDRTGTMQLWVMRADGGMPRQLTDLPGRNRYPSWTADGKQIVFQSLDAGNFEIYRINVDGTDISNLTNDPGVDWSPATSARGRKIAFTSERDGSGHLYVLTPDGAITRVTNTVDYDYFANWSPSGNDLVFIRENSSGENDIYVAHADGTGTRRLTNTPGRTEYFPAFSPDGKKVVYTACSPPKPLAAPNPVCSSHVMNLDGSEDVDLVFPTPETPFPFVDNFNDNIRDVNHWGLLHDGTGGFVNEANGRVEFSFAPDAAPSMGPFPAISVRYDFTCLLNADFDAQVDFELLDWPAANGATVQFHAFYADGTVARQSQDWGESYGAFFPPSSFNVVATDDQSGTLRLVRSGATYTGYYKSGGAWVELLSAPASQGAAILTIELASFGTFSHELVRVAFDNFRIVASDVDCSSSRPDWHPDWQPVARR